MIFRARACGELNSDVEQRQGLKETFYLQEGRVDVCVWGGGVGGGGSRGAVQFELEQAPLMLINCIAVFHHSPSLSPPPRPPPTSPLVPSAAQPRRPPEPASAPEKAF